MTSLQLVRFNFKGGIASPGELRDLLSALKACDITQVKFGLRQQLLAEISSSALPKLKERMAVLHTPWQLNKNRFPNLVSSYVAEEVFLRSNWLSEGIYKDIMDGFDYSPAIKINISDSRQSFTPFFSGHLNYISSDKPNFWFLFVRKPKSNEVFCHEKLIFTQEIARLSQLLEKRILSNENETILANLPEMITENAENPLAMPRFSLPYYEGFNRYGSKTWLGIYRREEYFSVNFLIDLCSLCLQTKIGEICLTPWKSLIIKNIQEKDRALWSNLLAAYDINVRHAANELNWQIEDNSSEAIRLKKRIINYFNRKDLRTFGICLGIKTVPKTEVFASIMVSRNYSVSVPFFKRYDITYTTDYDPNGRNVAYFDRDVPAYRLPQQLRKAVLQFNERLAGQNPLPQEELLGNSAAEPKQLHEVHECPSCLSIYDQNFGDPLHEIPAGIPFEKLPENYTCSICGENKSNFVKKEISLVIS